VSDTRDVTKAALGHTCWGVGDHCVSLPCPPRNIQVEMAEEKTPEAAANTSIELDAGRTLEVEDPEKGVAETGKEEPIPQDGYLSGVKVSCSTM
jgi:hypothetical protein